MSKNAEASKTAEEISKTAINVRGRAKSALTRLHNFINGLEQDFQKNDLLNKLEKLECIYQDFDRADAQLPFESSEMEEFELKYYETKVKLQTEIEKLSSDISVPYNIVNDQLLSNSNATTTVNSNFRLPKLNIDKFNGNFKNWLAFKDLYISLVHTNNTITNIQKFQYLRGLLTDEPASVIKHIPISENGYLEAWDKILSRYDRKKQIVASLIKTFMDQTPMNYSNSHNLRNIVDVSDEIIRALKSIDAKASSRDVWLIYILLQKLDDKTRQEWSLHSSKDEFPSFEHFIQFLNERCLSLEFYHGNESNKNKEKQFKAHKSSNSFSCVMCQSNSHFLFKCAKFKDLTVKNRKSFVKKNRLCSNCLSNRHNSFNCNSAFTCHFCSGIHHTLLCENKVQNYAMSTSTHSNETSEKRIEPDITILNTSKETNASINTVQTSFALLPTAMVQVEDYTGQKHMLRVMVDSGSESTFVSSECVKALGIRRKNARFPVKGLSNYEIAVTKGYATLNLISIHNAEVKLSVKAFILDKLTAPLPAEKINEDNFSHLKNVQLADPHFGIPNKIDIILGSDYFFSILLPGQVICPQSTLIAQNSIFGFLVSGRMPDSCTSANSISNLHIYEINIDKELKRFWEVEEIVNINAPVLSPEE